MSKQVFNNLNGNRITIPLSNLQTYYLRLFMHDYSNSQISTFLELGVKRLEAFKETIMEKFGSRDWSQIISWSFDLGLLKQNNYIDKIVKEEALNYTNKIFANHIVTTTSSSPFFAQNTIRSLILDFNESCQNIFLNQATNLPKLTDVYKKHLQLRFNGFKKNVILKALNISSDTYEEIQGKLLQHFSSNSMHSVLRKALKYGIIKNLTPENEERNEIILNNSVAQISLLKFVEHQGNKMRKLSIYSFLIEFYYKKNKTQYFIK